MYTRSPNFVACLRAMLGAGATVGNDLAEAALLDDEETLRRIIQEAPERVRESLTVESAYTSLRGVSALHVCAEFNSVRCAKVLLNAGVDVNVRAEVDADGLGGHTPLFHTVNSNQNYCRPMMNLLLDAGADVDVRLRGLVWGEGLEWETVVFDITPISYAQCGLYRQFHRDEKDIYDNISHLYLRRFGSPAPRRNVPNRYVFGN
jgi:ankyrin repeat protein